jgi:hypothetical protein
MILIKPNVYKAINQYKDYLTKEGLTTKPRAIEKRKLLFQALYNNLGGMVSHRISPYKSLGAQEGYKLYVYKDPKSKSQWGFAYQLFNDNNVIVYEMKNMKLMKEK